MVNYRRVVCEVAVLVAMVTAVAAAPMPCDDKHFDQRQNGTENYRLNIDGVVIAVAPAESFLAAASDIDFSDLLDFENLSEIQKPKPPASHSSASVASSESTLEPKPQEDKPQDSQNTKPVEPVEPAMPTDLSDVSLNSDVKGQKKEAMSRKQEKAHRLKNRLASLLMPLLRRNRHH